MTNCCARLNSVFQERKEEIALKYGKQEWSYGELLNEGAKRAHYWKKNGLKKGSRVLLYLPGDRLEYLFAVLAGVIGDYEIVTVSQKAVPSELTYIRNVVEPALEWNGVPTDSFEPVNPTDTFIKNIQIIFFTSGTTGKPKGVCHDFEKLLANAMAFNDLSGVDENTCMLHVMPTGYMAGLLNTFLSPLLAGGIVVLGELFDVKTALQFWNYPMEHHVNSIWLTPSMVATLVPLCRDSEIPEWTRNNLRHIFIGTAPLHKITRDYFRERFGVDCLESYGMTECMFISVNSSNSLDQDSTVGHPLKGVELEIRNGKQISDSNCIEGNIWIHSQFALTGYIEKAGDKQESQSEKSGWMDTGDIGYIDASGRIVITGRSKDIIIHGGINVSPRQVEEVLLSYSEVKEAAVIGSPHTFWGEEVEAYVITESGKNIDIDKLGNFCRDRLNVDAVPSRYVVVKEFPRTSNGKVQKHLLG